MYQSSGEINHQKYYPFYTIPHKYLLQIWLFSLKLHVWNGEIYAWNQKSILFSSCRHRVWFLEEPSLSLVCLSVSLDLDRKRWLYSFTRPFYIPLQDYLWATQGWHCINMACWMQIACWASGRKRRDECLQSQFVTSHLGWSIVLSSQLLAELVCSEWNRKKSA